MKFVDKLFLWCLSLPDVRHCRKLSSYVIWRKTYDPRSRKWRKISFRAWFRLIGLCFGQLFFWKRLVSSVSIYHGQLKFSHGQTEGHRTKRQTDRRKRVISYGAVGVTSSVQEYYEVSCDNTAHEGIVKTLPSNSNKHVFFKDTLMQIWKLHRMFGFL